MSEENKKTSDELVDEMADEWDAMDEENYSSCKIDAYLEALDKKMPLAIDTEASLAAFREKHARLLEQMAPIALPLNIESKPRRAGRLRVLRLVAAALAVILGCMMTAQALGFDVFGTIARWTDEIFYFSGPSQTENNQVSPPPAGSEYSNLQEALSDYGITELIAPSWVPPEFHLIDFKIIPTPASVKFQTAYEDGEKFLSITVWQYSSENTNSVIFEKDEQDVVLYEKNGVKHYIMSNNTRITAAWTNKSLMCSLSGDISMDEAKHMIDSIYKK
jgi:hypothetical protein